MRFKTLFKIALISALAMILLAPLAMIQSTVAERAAYREQARTGIAESWTGAQRVIGPMLVLPYRTVTTSQVWDKAAERYATREEVHQRRDLVLPERLRIDAHADTQLRRRGIYAVPVYAAKLKLAGHFSRAEVRARIDARQAVEDTGQPYLVMLVGDTRGFSVRPLGRWGEVERAFAPGASPETAIAKGLSQQPGLHLPVPEPGADGADELAFAIDLDLRGMERIAFAPLGKDTQVRLTSPWPHPSFTGRFLPERHEISGEGFTALWRTSSFAGNAGAKAEACIAGGCAELAKHVFGVGLIQPTDVYLKTERAVKYGALFILLTFTAAFLFEITRGRAIHPVQYALVGLALATFFLLLLALSEHIAFGLAYLIAAAAVTALLGHYGTAVAGSRRNGLALGGAVAALYGVLYVILAAEDTALLMGSLLLFAVLGAVMTTTRRLDWHALEEGLRHQAANGSGRATDRPT